MNASIDFGQIGRQSSVIDILQLCWAITIWWPNLWNLNSYYYNIHRIHRIWPPVTLFISKLEKWLGRQRFTSNEKVIAETDAYFEDLQKSYFLDGLKKLEKRLEKCIELKGDYVENLKKNMWIGIPILLPRRFHKVFSLRNYVA